MPNQKQNAAQLKWERLIEEQRASGLTIKQWCSERSIKASSFHYWKERLFPKSLQKSNFSELSIKREPSIILQTQGLHIRLDYQCDPKLRKQLFALLAEMS